MGVSVRRRGKAWWVFVRHKNRRKAKKVGDREAARRVAKEITERLAREDLQLPLVMPEETLKIYSEEWLKAAGSTLKASTIRFYRDHLENHVIPLLGSQVLSTLARRDVKRLLIELRKKGLQPKTITGVVRTLSRILSEAVEDEKLPANPALRPGRLRRGLSDPNNLKKVPIDPYTRDEAKKLAETARQFFPDWFTFLLCALRTGLRLGELRALEWGDLDWQQRFVHVERNFVEGEFTTPKNGSTRNVDMSLQLHATLRVWRRLQQALWLTRGRPQPDLVFPSEVGTPLDDSKIRKAMRAIEKKAEVRRRRSSFHVLRHTFGSLLIQQGESLVYVMEQMGHSSIQVTVDVYGHLVPGGDRDAVDRLDDGPEGATNGNLSATAAKKAHVKKSRKSCGISGEPPGNRTLNPQIKSSAQLTADRL
jgi:integrase